jgi:hypothetical protein
MDPNAWANWTVDRLIALGYLAFPVHHKTLPMMRHEDQLANETDWFSR